MLKAWSGQCILLTNVELSFHRSCAVTDVFARKIRSVAASYYFNLFFSAVACFEVRPYCFLLTVRSMYEIRLEERNYGFQNYRYHWKNIPTITKLS